MLINGGLYNLNKALDKKILRQQNIKCWTYYNKHPF